MSSFLNKKLNLILLVLATLIIATTITSASATVGPGNNTVELNESFGSDNATLVDITKQSSIKYNGTLAVIDNETADITYNGPNGPLGNKTIQIVAEVFGNPRYVLGTTTTNASGQWAFTITPNMLRDLGVTSIFAQFTEASNNATGFNDTVNVFSTGLLLQLRGTPTISIVPTATPLRVGQNATFLVTVTGPNATNTSQIINLEGIFVTIVDQLGNFAGNGTTNENGTFTFNYVVTALSFYFNATTVNASNDTYTEANASVPFTAQKGQANLTELWFDSPYGYVIGQNATILWNFNGIDLTTIGNRTITLFYYSNNKLQRTEVVPLYSPLNVNNRNAMGHWNTTFTQAHTNLTVIAVFPEDTDYLRSEVRNSTFVDASNESRRTTVNYTLPTIGLKVGQTSDIQIKVFSFNGTAVQSGTVSVIWDGLYKFDIDLVNGTAFFTHTYTTAGAARNVTFVFNGDTVGNAPSNVSATLPVLKGTPSIVVTQQPAFAVVGQAVTIAGAINNIALGTTPQYVTLQFISASGNVLHTINNISMTVNTASSAVAQVTYTYIQPHTSLSLVMTFVGNNNYNNASGSTTTIVSAAPVV